MASHRQDLFAKLFEPVRFHRVYGVITKQPYDFLMRTPDQRLPGRQGDGNTGNVVSLKLIGG